MKMILGTLFIIYGFCLFRVGLKENFSIWLGLKLFDNEGKFSPGIWSMNNNDEKKESDTKIELPLDQVSNTNIDVGKELGYEPLSNLENQKSLIKISDNTISFVPSSYFRHLPNLEKIDAKNEKDLGVDFEILKKNSQDIKVVAFVSNGVYSRQNETLQNVEVFSRKVLSEAENAILLNINDIKINNIRSIPVKDSLHYVGVLEIDVNGFEKINTQRQSR